MTLGYQTQGVDERKLAEILKVVCHENTLWSLDVLKRGQTLPRSAEAAGLMHCPDQASRSIIFLDAATLLELGQGSCGSIAALDVGLLRARAVIHQRVPLPAATGRYQVRLLRRPGTDSIDYWHAVVRTPNGLMDPTVNLRKVCPTPEYA